MAIYGLGAVYDNEQDATSLFVRNGVAALGWAYQDAPSFHEIFKAIKVGDMIYIKDTPIIENLIIKAIGIVIDNEITAIAGIGEACIHVRWIWQGQRVVEYPDDKYNIRNLALYEEPNPLIKRQVLDLLFTRLA
jgi:hypothetical protein